MICNGHNNLKCLTCGAPVWDLIGQILVSKPRNTGSVRRCLECAIESNVLASNVSPELDIGDEGDG